MQGTFQPSFIEIGPRVYEEMSFEEKFTDGWTGGGMTDNDHTKAPLKHVVLRGANKIISTTFEENHARNIPAKFHSN